MIREKIRRLNRHRSSPSSSSASSASADASGQKFVFNFSNIQAVQVPEGWDKIVLSLVSSESGKTIRKLGKVQVKNGTCQWNETLSETIWISDVKSSKELDEYLCKFVVSMGSSKSGVLGETMLNLAAFLSSESPILVSLPLKNCNYGTVLQVEVTCLTPKTDLSNEKWKTMNGITDKDADEADHVESTFEVESCNSNNSGNLSRPSDISIRETSFSPSASHRSFDSKDDSLERQISSSQSDQIGANNAMARQDSNESSDSASSSSYSTHSGSVKSVRSIQRPNKKQGKDQGQPLEESSPSTTPSLQQNSGPQDTLKESGDLTAQELEAQALMWERNARKLSLDLETTRKELFDQNLMVTNLNIELAISRSDCQKLTQEVERLKSLLAVSVPKQNTGRNSEIQEITSSNIQKEMEDEIRFLKEQNENLSSQLKQTHESNIKLIALLQELEETAEQQKHELEKLSASKLDLVTTDSNKDCRYEDSGEVSVGGQVSTSEVKINHELELDPNEVSINHTSAREVKIFHKSKSDTTACETPVITIHEHIPQENNHDLELELLNLQDALKTSRDRVLLLESTLDDMIIEIEIEQDLRNHILRRCFNEFSCRMDDKEGEIMSLKAASHILRRRLDEFSCRMDDKEREIMSLKAALSKAKHDKEQKIMNLEAALSEAKHDKEQEIMSLEAALSKVKHDKEQEIMSLDAALSKAEHDKEQEIRSLEAALSKVRQDKEQEILSLEAALSKALSGNSQEAELSSNVEHSQEIQLFHTTVQELETDCDEPGKSLADEPTSSILCLRDELLDYDSTALEDNTDSFEKEKYTKAMNCCQEATERDCTISASDFFSSSVSDTVLCSSSSISSHVSENNVEDIGENINTQWLKHVTELEEENIYLLERVFGLEAQLRYLTDAKESSCLELQHSESQVMILQDQVRRLEEEIESQRLDAKQKLQGMEERWIQAREECESLGKTNIKLQMMTETLAEECNILQKFNGELKEGKVKLQDQCMHLEAEARKFRGICCSCAAKIGPLEAIYSLLKQEHGMRSGSDGVWRNLEGILAANREKLMKLFEVTTNYESKYQLVIDELESKLKDSELGRLRLDEENCMLKMQLHQVPELQNKVLGLRVSLKEMKSQTQLLEASFKSISEECEELKRERVSMAQRISNMSEVVSAAEGCRRKRNAMEEKILRLEGDLIAREQLYLQDAEMKHELGQMKISNSQLMLKVKHLEEVREHLQSKLQSHEDRSRAKEHLKVQDIYSEVQHDVQVFKDERSTQSQAPEKDYETRVQHLGIELGQAMKANNACEMQFKSARAVVSKDSESKVAIDTTVAKHKISLLEAELHEICQRYLHMSLKYAEVESQRERLVMKLKALSKKSGLSL